MKIIGNTLLIAAMFYTGYISAQSPISVADTSFKLPILGEESLYFGFAEGDQLIFNFEEQNGKDLKELEIIEYPNTSRYKDDKISHVENKTISISHTGIYQFRFANTVMFPKNCRLKIQRIPASKATSNFNSTVYWRTVFDTTYRNLQPHVTAETYKTVDLVSPTTYYLEANTPETKPRLTIPINLPDFTSEWYYEYAVTTDKKKSETLKSSLQLASHLRQKISETGNLSFGIDSFPVPKGSDTCRIYLLDQSNQQLFENKMNFRHFKEGTRENTAAGLVKIKTANFPNAYLGLRNTDPNFGIYIALEAVAIIAPDDSSQLPETQSVSIKARREPYLKN